MQEIDDLYNAAKTKICFPDEGEPLVDPVTLRVVSSDLVENLEQYAVLLNHLILWFYNRCCKKNPVKLTAAIPEQYKKIRRFGRKPFIPYQFRTKRPSLGTWNLAVSLK